MKVGVILPLSTDDGGPSYVQIRTWARAAEAAGLDSVWIYDHLLYRFPDKPPQGIWEGWTVMSALAEATERVELGALVLCAAFRNPAVLAKMAATLDEISGGRIILGLGAGWHEPEFAAFGLPFDHLVDRFAEALAIIVPLLRDGAVDFTGKYVSAPSCALLPMPARRIPILIASAKERMLKLTARHADQWNTAWVGEVSETAERRAALLAACEAVGRDPRTLEQTVGVNVVFADLPGAGAIEKDPKQALRGDVGEVAMGLRRYVESGIGHVIAMLAPMSEEAIQRLARAAEVARMVD
jgi:alkanesulfonate monooxygenase SsuD/methylene tetrahydromethanopterin reductase-like flavin-dependent oxidoreductase (luciferase family)